MDKYTEQQDHAVVWTTLLPMLLKIVFTRLRREFTCRLPRDLQQPLNSEQRYQEVGKNNTYYA
jgi:hypothetical protein